MSSLCVSLSIKLGNIQGTFLGEHASAKDDELDNDMQSDDMELSETASASPASQ